MKRTTVELIHAKLCQALEFQKNNNFPEAQAICREVLTIDPRNADAWHLLGLAAWRCGDLQTAKNRITKATKIKANEPAYLSNLGIVLKDLGEHDAALACFGRALRLQPNYPEARSNRGLTFTKMGKHEEALTDYDAAIALRPSYAAAHSNRGISLQHVGRSEEALASFRKAIACDPAFSDAWSNYATLLRRLRRHAESLQIYDHALKLNPNNVTGFQGRGELLIELDRLNEAISDFDRALAINPHYADPLWGKGYAYLRAGDFDKGLDFYDFRFAQSNQQASVLKTDKPRWTPARATERLLLWSEQGIGDELFFAQWLGNAHRLGHEVTVAVDERLLTTHSRSFRDLRFIDKNESIPWDCYDCHIPLGSLPKALRDFGIAWQTHRKIPYLIADAHKTATLRADLTRGGKRICGVTWRSNRPELGAEKSLSLENLLPILHIPDYVFISLQYGDTRKEIEQLRNDTGIEIYTHPTVDNFEDLENHIALTAACDELVLACNATAHVAGAMGKHAHLLAPRGKSLLWYWANRINNRNFWYSSIEIFDQTQQLSWIPAVDQVAKKLTNKV